jgi:hypothetical protein
LERKQARPVRVEVRIDQDLFFGQVNHQHIGAVVALRVRLIFQLVGHILHAKDLQYALAIRDGVAVSAVGKMGSKGRDADYGSNWP